jgi:hypothetical protein
MSNYRIRARRHTHPRLGGTGISDAAIGWLIPDAVLVESATEAATAVVEVQLERETHLEALNEIFGALQRLGYSVIESTVSEWVDRAVETAIVAALGVGSGAHAVAKNAKATVAAGIFAAIIGHWAGKRLGRLEVVYELAPTPSGGWSLEAVAQSKNLQAPLFQS